MPQAAKKAQPKKAPPRQGADLTAGKAWPRVEVYTVGDCWTNPGAGGCAALLRWQGADGVWREKELSAGDVATTNNRESIAGAILALETLTRPSVVVVRSNSEYLVRGINTGMAKWAQSGFTVVKRSKPLANADLWKRLWVAVARHEVEAVWSRSSDDVHLNRASYLMRTAAIKAQVDKVRIEGPQPVPRLPPFHKSWNKAKAGTGKASNLRSYNPKSL